MRAQLSILILLFASAACGGDGMSDTGADSGLDSMVDAGDGDVDDACSGDCSFACLEDVNCDDGDPCNGAEECDLVTNTCIFGDPLDCDDDDPCTADACDMELGCVHPIDDADGDRFAPAAICTDVSIRGGDCDDDDSTVYPGAPEICDLRDNDCDGTVDDGVIMRVCLRDADGDGYGDAAEVMTGCSCPAGYIPPRPDGEVDCSDREANAHPNQTMYFGAGYCPSSPVCPWPGSFDYDCDGMETLAPFFMADVCTPFLGACIGSGWIGFVIGPPCGSTGPYQECVADSSEPSGCATVLSTRAHECR